MLPDEEPKAIQQVREWRGQVYDEMKSMDMAEFIQQTNELTLAFEQDLNLDPNKSKKP